MNISTRAMVSNSDMIRIYKACREKAEELGKIFVLKNNQPDAVLFSISEYEKFSKLIELLDGFEGIEITKAIEFLRMEEIKKDNVVNI